ncbi:hypothetical protein [Micromonospora sp. NPDC049374]|uniref:hypothetical protein n=1 Tax=Micromonospora sp. NPDC049374 TaxID=3154352 RepID=UPI00342BB360
MSSRQAASNHRSAFSHGPEQLGDHTFYSPVELAAPRHIDHETASILVTGVSTDGGGVVLLQVRPAEALAWYAELGRPPLGRHVRIGSLVDAHPVGRHGAVDPADFEETQEKGVQARIAVDELKMVIATPRLRFGALAPVDRRTEDEQITSATASARRSSFALGRRTRSGAGTPRSIS